MALNLVERHSHRTAYPWSPADVNEPATPTHSAAGAHRQRALAARDRRARGHGPAAARAPGARAARERRRDGRRRLPRRAWPAAAPSPRISRCATRSPRCRRPSARCASPGRARSAPGGYAALDRSARRAAGSLTRRAARRARVELNDVRFGSGPRQARGGQRHRPLRPPARRAAAGRAARPRAARSCRSAARRCGGSTSTASTSTSSAAATLTSLVPFGDGRARDAADRPAASGPSRCCSRRASAASRRCRRCACSRATTAGRRRSTRAARTSGTSTACSPRRAAREARLTAANGQFGLTAPDDALAEARSEGSTASRRVLLVGGAAAVLLLAFAGLTAGALRRDVRAELRRLGQRGATLSQQAAFVLAEALSAVLPGVVAGPRARDRGRRGHRAPLATCPSAPALSHGLATPASVALVAAGALGALAVVALALRRPHGRPARPASGPSTWPPSARVVALGAAARRRLARRRRARAPGPALTLAATPLLASFAFAVLLGRLLEPAIRTGLRASRNGARHAPPRAARAASLALARRRRRGLPRRLGRPRDVRALLPRHARPLERRARRLRRAARLHAQRGRGARRAARRRRRSRGYRALAPGVGAWPVLRQVADAAGTRGAPLTPTVLGVPCGRPAAAARLARRLLLALAAELARLLRPRAPVALAGAAIPRRGDAARAAGAR